MKRSKVQPNREDHQPSPRYIAKGYRPILKKQTPEGKPLTIKPPPKNP